MAAHKNALPDCPESALREIVKFIRSIPLSEGNRIPPQSDPRAFDGYALSIEWIYGLLEVAEDAERVAQRFTSGDS